MAKKYDPTRYNKKRKGVAVPALWDGVSLPPYLRKLYDYLKTHPTFSYKQLQSVEGGTYYQARHKFERLQNLGLIKKRIYWDVYPVPFGDEEINKGVFTKGRWKLEDENKARIPKCLRQSRNTPNRINTDVSDAYDFFSKPLEDL
jgi:hypothetical protein